MWMHELPKMASSFLCQYRTFAILTATFGNFSSWRKNKNTEGSWQWRHGMNLCMLSCSVGMNTSPCTRELPICILVTHRHVSNHNLVFSYVAAEACTLFFKYENAFSLWLVSSVLICWPLNFDPSLVQRCEIKGTAAFTISDGDREEKGQRWVIAGVAAAEIRASELSTRAGKVVHEDCSSYREGKAGDEAEFSGDPKSAVEEEGYLVVGLSFLGTNFAVFF